MHERCLLVMSGISFLDGMLGLAELVKLSGVICGLVQACCGVLGERSTMYGGLSGWRICYGLFGKVVE